MRPPSSPCPRRKYIHGWSATVSIYFITLACHAITASGLAAPQPQTSLASQAKLAADLTSKANLDPSYADEACKLWSSILYTGDGARDGSSIVENDNNYPLPLAAMPVVHALYASSLARIGRDKEAIVEYQASLTFFERCVMISNPATKEEVDVRMGMGKSLQRLLLYRQAVDCFVEVTSRCASKIGNEPPENGVPWALKSYSESARRAALCSMRLGELDKAIQILEGFENSTKGRKETGILAEVSGMHGALLLLKHDSDSSITRTLQNESVDDSPRHMLRLAINNGSSSPLYDWLYHVSQIGRDSTTQPFSSLLNLGDDIFLLLAEANNSPFDDPDLLNLDDKILLHSVVMDPIPVETKTGFWPLGFVLPREIGAFSNEIKREGSGAGSEKRWILKERAGYGSRGNRVVSSNDVLSIYDTSKESLQSKESLLCQKIVDPPMLIGGRKFSLRVYVIYFPGGTASSPNGKRQMDAQVLLSTEGLVKFASAQLLDDASNRSDISIDDQYMTNSGRGDGRSSLQHDLYYLRREFEERGLDYDRMWDRIQKSIRLVMKRYLHLKKSSANDLKQVNFSNCNFNSLHRTYTPFCTIPKIMGFDFILDSSQTPWLLEVNRFPGLEPRCDWDLAVKHAVIYDAWLAAVKRVGFSTGGLEAFCPSNYKGFSLTKISLD